MNNVSGKMQCRKAAPSRELACTVWPIVQWDAWCGDWRQK